MESYFSYKFDVRVSTNVLKEIGTTKPRIPFHISAGFGLQNQGGNRGQKKSKILQTILETPNRNTANLSIA